MCSSHGHHSRYDLEDYAVECCHHRKHNRHSHSHRHSRDQLQVVRWSPWNFERFAWITQQTFKHEFSCTNKSVIREILLHIWNNINHENRNELALFVATSLHNTSFYKVFEDKCTNERYRSRGLVMIQNIENYRLLTRISHTTNYINCPDILASITNSAVRDTIKFWKHKLNGNYTFRNMMEALNIASYFHDRHSQDIENWLCIYRKLFTAYCDE